MATHYDINWLTERVENNSSIKYLFFWGHTNNSNEEVGKFCFSQWYQLPFIINGIKYKTAEHWMMAHKALLFNDKSTFDKIINCNKPGEAKELGRQVVDYNDHIWNEKKFEIVKLGNIHKFNQHPKFAEYLMNTDNRVLVEASPVDTIWGIGLSQDSRDAENIYAWRGLNLLGFALMEARDFLTEFGLFTPLDNSIQPPWLMFPEISSQDMFWRMGKGENYMKTFSEYYEQLTEREKMVYQLTNPQPYEWTTFY